MSNKMKHCKVCSQEIAKTATACPYCGARHTVPLMVSHPVGGTILLIILVLFCIPIFAILGSDGSNPQKIEGADPNAQAAISVDGDGDDAKAPIQVSATDLYSTYTENEINADNQYKDKLLTVTGVITNIGKDVLTDAPCVSLDSGSQYGLYPIQCFFPKSEEHNEILAALKDGQTVTITGECTGFFVASVQVSECSITE